MHMLTVICILILIGGGLPLGIILLVYWRYPRLFYFIKESNRKPPVTIPTVTPDLNELSVKHPLFRFMWMGHSFFMLEIAGVRILVDPVFGSASPIPGTFHRFQPVPIQRQQFPSVDLILITHNHYDHLESSTIRYFAQQQHTRFIVPQGVERELHKLRCPPERITPLQWWQSTAAQDLQITFTPSQHYSHRHLRDYNQSLWGGYAICSANTKIYIGGDGGYNTHFHQIGQKLGPFDYAFLDIGAWNEAWHTKHLFPEEALQAALDVQAKHLVPSHWGAYNLAYHQWDTPILRLKAALEQQQLPRQFLVTPLIGALYLAGNSTTDWWELVQPKP